MLNSDASRTALERLFAQHPVADLTLLGRTLGTHSRMSVFRRLSALGYLSSYSHTGRYYTLASIPQFDVDGLWRWQQVGFSRDGTLKATVRRLVETSDSGHTQRELQRRLGVRVHNLLLDLVESRQLRRESIDEGEYVYVAAGRRRATTQMERRRAMASETVGAPPSASLEVEVLLEVIHGVRRPELDAAKVVAALGARGIRASVAEVAAVFDRHGLKKTPRSRSPRSKR